MPAVTFRLSHELDARLTAASRERRTTKSAFVREILASQLPRRVRKQPTAYDLVKHLVGCLSGPRDLSHHRRHYASFAE